MKQLRFEKDIYARIFEAALPFLQTRQNEIHTRICLAFGARLLRGEGGDPDIVVPGILLHDVGWSRVPEHLQLSAFGPNMTSPRLRDLHEREGAAIAGEILATLAYPVDQTRVIVEIISRHDSRPDAESLEEEVVKDADKLWRYSPEGLAIDLERFGVEPETHLSFLEGALDTWFLTATGRQMPRAEFLKSKRELRCGTEGGAHL